MYINIEQNGKTPVYMQIYYALRSRIISGAFQYGSKLPSKRQLAEDCGVSAVTTEHAYSLLCEEGYCEARQRSGCYVTYRNDESFPVAEPENYTDIPVLSESEEQDSLSYYAFSSHVRKVLSVSGRNILLKSPNNGCPELRTAISRYLSRNRNIDASPEQIIIGSGAEYLYGLCIQMLGRDKLVALENPSYEKIKQVYNANGAECDMLEMDIEGIRTDELQRTKAKILHVTPFHSFPSDITASASRRREYIEWAEKNQAYIIEDDYDSEFILTGVAPETLYSMSHIENVVYINTFSRTIAPSIRAGYMIIPEKLLPLYREKIGFYSCTVPMLEQYFLADWIDSGEFERNINRIRHRTEK